MKNQNKNKEERLYTVDRLFTGTRTVEEVVADLIRAHMESGS